MQTKSWRMLAAFLLLTSIPLSASAFEYQRSRWQFEDLPIQCTLNTLSIPHSISLADAEMVVKQSLDAWNQAAELVLFVYAGRSEIPIPVSDDGVNAISFVSHDWQQIVDKLSVNRSTLATTITWTVRDPVGSEPRHGITRSSFLRTFDIILNAEKHPWVVKASPGRYDAHSVIVHELGHVLGLGHTDADPHTPDAPTMVGKIGPNDTRLRTLEADDVAGIRTIYRSVSGVLRSDAHWENMVWIAGNVTVPAGISLKVSHSTPQTTLCFSPGTKLIIEGSLVIKSFHGNPIGWRGTDASQWQGIEIRTNSEPCSLAKSSFEGTQTPVTLRSASDITIQKCEFNDSLVAVRADSSGHLSVSESDFGSNVTAIHLQSTSEARVEDCEFVGNSTAIQMVDSESVSVHGRFVRNDVAIHAQTSRAVELVGGSMQENGIGIRLVQTGAFVQAYRLTENEVAVEVQSDTPARFRENTFLENQVAVQLSGIGGDLGRSPDDPGQNNLLDSHQWNVLVEAGTMEPVFAQGNYWESEEPDEIDATIWDDDESAERQPVIFLPTLHAFHRAESGWLAECTTVKTHDRPWLGVWPTQEAFIDHPPSSAHAKYQLTEDDRVIVGMVMPDAQGNKPTMLFASAQGSSWPDWYKLYEFHFRIVNFDPRTPGFSIQCFLSENDAHDVADTILQLSGPSTHILTNSIQENQREFSYRFALPDLPIEGDSEEYYVWARLLFDDGKEALPIPGEWLLICEDAPDLVGRIHEASELAFPGRELTVRYSIQNYGKPAKGHQKVQFYLSEDAVRLPFLPFPKPDYTLSPTPVLNSLEGEWTSQLTVPVDAAQGDYHLWMLVDVDNNILERDGHNNPATYLAHQIHIGNAEDAPPVSVEVLGRHPITWAELRTDLLPNYPNPLNPETWLPYQLADESTVTIRIYDIRGAVVRHLWQGQRPAGSYTSQDRAAYWDGRDENGQKVSSGIYLYELDTGTHRRVRKLVVLK